MDRQAWIAVALCIIGLLAWQIYVVKHSLPVPQKTATFPGPSLSAPPAPSPTEAHASSGPTPSPNESTPTPTPTSQSFVEKTTTLKNGDLELLLTNRGGGIAEAILPRHKG